MSSTGKVLANFVILFTTLWKNIEKNPRILEMGITWYSIFFYNSSYCDPEEITYTFALGGWVGEGLGRWVGDSFEWVVG